MTLCPLLTHVLAVQEIVDLNLNFQHIQKHFSYFLQIFMYDISLLSCLRLAYSRIAKLRIAYLRLAYVRLAYVRPASAS